MLQLVAATRRWRVGGPRACCLLSTEVDTPSLRSYWEEPHVANPRTWERVVAPAFRAFLRNKQHLLVPLRFRVPVGDEEWPEQTWGYPLGEHAGWLRKRWRREKLVPDFAADDLKDMDFALDRSQYKWNHYVKPALQRYYEIFGHTDVPQVFRVEVGDEQWPERLWGLLLGPKVFNIRHRGDFAKQVKQDAEELARMSFCYSTSTYERDWCENVLPSLKLYKQEFGHCDVPSAFVVPGHAPWPKRAAGLSLGKLVNNVRGKGYYAEQVERDMAELDEIGFVWAHFQTNWEERIFPALETYAEMHGHSFVPSYFVVPSTAPWPEETHDLKLGMFMKNIRSYGYYFDYTSRHVDELAGIGFDLQIPEIKWKARVDPLLDIFEQVHGHRDVPCDFVVPSEAPWEKNSWGIQLGKLERKI